MADPHFHLAVGRYREAVQKHGFHGFVADETIPLVGRQRPRCRVCGLVEASKVHPHADVDLHLPKRWRKRKHGASRAHRLLLKQKLDQFGQHKFESNLDGSCLHCGLTRKSRIHRTEDSLTRERKRKSRIRAQRTAVVKTPDESLITVVCPWCNGSGEVHISRDELRKRLS